MSVEKINNNEPSIKKESEFSLAHEIEVLAKRIREAEHGHSPKSLSERTWTKPNK